MVALVHHETGEVRARSVPDVTARTLRTVLDEEVDRASPCTPTRPATTSRSAGSTRATSPSNHRVHEYVRGDVTTNRAEGFFSQLKRSVDGTHHHVSRAHLNRYLGEFAFRSSTHHITDTERMTILMGQVGGRRLTYQPLRHQPWDWMADGPPSRLVRGGSGS
ncbi:hypothetical protein BH20ACT7_BH20ACT7_12900 [soil metagenome]